MDQDQDAPLWVITSQQETVDLAASGAYVNGTRVAFRTRSGALGSVFIPSTEYNPAGVRSKVNQLATDMENVHNMKGEG
jgi:hypothetical protein